MQHHQPAWELVIYSEYLLRGGDGLFSKRYWSKYEKHDLPTGTYRLELIGMATKKAAKKGNYDGNLQWCNVPLSDEDANAIDGWEVTDAELLAGVMELQLTGHSYTGKLANDGVGYTAIAIGVSSNCDNQGRGLSAFASAPRDALKALLYKHFTLVGGLWPEPTTSAKRRYS